MALAAIPVGSSQPGILRVVSPAGLQAAERQAIDMAASQPEQVLDGIAAHIRRRFEIAWRHRTSNGIEQKLIDALRAYRGQYSAQKLAEIRQFKGSEVYAKLTAQKCRAATALLRDIYMAGERPWEIDPTADPEIPGHITDSVDQLIQSEVQFATQSGDTITPDQLQQRKMQLMDAAKKAEMKKAVEESFKATFAIEDHLQEGGFYKALDEFLDDLPIFPFACIKGPVVRNTTHLKWQQGGGLSMTEAPRMFWDRVSPFDLFFAPNASRIENSYVIERIRLTRAELYDMIGQPGYDEEAIRDILDRSGAGGVGLSMKWREYFETERAWLENRDTFALDDDTISALEYHGTVRGKWLLDWGMTKRTIKDPDREYFVTGWLIDNRVIKIHVNPAPRQRPMYYVSSFEKVPGAIIGSALPEMLEDIQGVANATLRALANNLGIASGPQVVINVERAAAGADTEQLYPWKRWYVTSDPYQNAVEKPVDFYQPDDRSAPLLSVFKEFSNMADEVSSLPRYLTGSQRTGGAASTSSGLSMLMGNASKVLQSVAANIDNDVIKPLLKDFYDILMLTSPDTLRGDEDIVVKGVASAMQREQDRVRQLEFLQITANPIDSQILGVPGRTALLRSLSRNLGLDYEQIVPEAAQNSAQANSQAGIPTPPQPGTPGAGVPVANPGNLPAPDQARSDGGQPRLDVVSNRGTS
jgi:hypothetical protein